MTLFDTVIIGNGLMGSAAARHLSGLGESVAVVGPDEPADAENHDGVFSSHYDQGRLTRRLDGRWPWAPLTERAMAGYDSLEIASGIDFHSPVGALVVVPCEAIETDNEANPLTMLRAFGVPHRVFRRGDDSWKQEFPHLWFPDTHCVIHEPGPAGYINPMRLIRAQNIMAEACGAIIFKDVATAVDGLRGDFTVATSGGLRIAAQKVLVAAGAFSNFNDLVTSDLPLTIETEVIALARVSDADADRLRGTPTVKYMIDDPALDAIYLIPPVRYPDGRYYIKLGANSPSDQVLTTLAQVQTWFRHGDSDHLIPDFAAAVGSMWPDTVIESVQSKRCILCRTPTGDPIIDEVSDGVFVVTGGNGGGAKGSDAWGELAAGLVHDGRWPEHTVRFTG